MKKHLPGLCVLIIIGVVASLLTPPLAYCLGVAQASMDILHAKHRAIRCRDVCTHGAVGLNRFEKLLAQNYGIETLYEDSCLTNRTVNYRVRGYNAVQVPYVEMLLGKENLDNLYLRAKREREAEIAAQIARENNQ